MITKERGNKCLMLPLPRKVEEGEEEREEEGGIGRRTPNRSLTRWPLVITRLGGWSIVTSLHLALLPGVPVVELGEATKEEEE